MIADYGLLAAAMNGMGEPLPWAYVVLMWITVGNGLRYGNRYLVVAVTMGQHRVRRGGVDERLLARERDTGHRPGARPDRRADVPLRPVARPDPAPPTKRAVRTKPRAASWPT